MALKVALLGAESTGKTTLSRSLVAALQAEGRPAAAVPEVLRAWCEREGRAPRPHEQLAIAQEQERLVDAASASHDIVIADTAALVVLVYSGMLFFEDDALYRFAVDTLRRYGLVLLMGLDLPWVPDGLQRHAASRVQVDAQLRELLQRHCIPHRVIYGQGEDRTLQAMAPVHELLGQPREQPAPRWVGACETCSDPDCEHRLFTALRGLTAPTK